MMPELVLILARGFPCIACSFACRLVVAIAFHLDLRVWRFGWLKLRFEIANDEFELVSNGPVPLVGYS